jgi:hypothetical protein
MSEAHTVAKGGVSIERRKSCERCSSEFSCFTSDCWCNELPNIMPLDEKRGCLCPVCLEEVISQKFQERNTNL